MSANQDLLYAMQAIENWLLNQGYGISVRELMEALGLSSTASVMYRLDRLKREGLVTWTPRTQRTLRLTEKGRALLTWENERRTA